MALSPQEQTWAQLQENLRRKRQRLGFGSNGRNYNGHKKAPPAPLPRILDSPTEAPLRGSHYPVIPPVANDRLLEDDDSLSLQSYDSEINLGQSEDYNTLLPQTSSHPYPRNGTTRGDHQIPWAARDPWNTSTKVKRDKGYFVQAEPNHRRPRKHQLVPFDGRGRQMVGGRVGGSHGRHVWRDPLEEAYTEHKSATVVQRHFRGYRTRKGLELLRYLQHPPSASSFMHHFLRDILQHDFILDVPKTSTSKSVVNTLTIRHSPTENQRFWQEALKRPDIHKPVAAKLILEVLDEEYRGVMLDAVNELVEDYLGTKEVVETTNQIITDVVVEMIPSVFKESRTEVAMETVIDELIDEEMQLCVSSFLEKILVMGKMPLDSAEAELEKKEVARVAESILLDATFMDHLLSTVICNGQLWSQWEYMDRFLDDRLLEIFLGQYIGILHMRRAVHECVPLKRLHEKVITDVALQTILGELSDQLMEDLEDLDEEERNHMI